MKQRREKRVELTLLSRVRGMRQEQAPAEQKLWRLLHDRQLNGFKFRRQFAIESYIADFYCAAAKLIVELDGESHDGREDYDEQRSAHLRSLSFEVIRFS